MLSLNNILKHSLLYSTRKNCAGGIVGVVIAIVVVEVEHSCIVTIVVVAPAFEPRVTRVREVRAYGLRPISLINDIKFLLRGRPF